MHDRRVARSVVIAAVMVFALVSIPRLRLEYASDVSFPELAVRLQLPPSENIDSVDMTRRWVLPIENALRSIGDSTGTRGEVDAGSAMITARFTRGTDVEVKAARLASDLTPLRARLPERSTLSIWPAHGGGSPSAVFAVTAADAGGSAAALADALRSTPGVRDVEIFGGTKDEVDVRLTNGAPPREVIDSILHGIVPRPLGEMREGSRRVAIVSARAADDIRDLPVAGSGAVRLASMANIREQRQAPSTLARLNGRDAAMISVIRDDDVPLFTFDRAVRRVVGMRATPMWSDAAELRIILRRLMLGAVAAAIVLAIGGAPAAALYVPLAIAILINVWRIGSLRVDAGTLLVSAVALAAVAPFAAARTISRDVWPLVVAMFFAAMVPIAATFGSGALAPILAAPARNFVLAVAGALAAASLLPGGTARRPSAAMKHALRNAASVVLVFLTAGVFLLSWFGNRLDPRRSEGSADRSRLYVRLLLPSGSTLERTAAAAARIEDRVQGLDGVKRFWTWASAERATVVVEVKPNFQKSPRFEFFRAALAARLPNTTGSVTIEDRFNATSGSALAETIEDQPFADESGSAYRFLLKGTDAGVLRRTAVALETRIARLGIGRDAIRAEWPEASPRIELIPRRDTPPDVAGVVARVNAERTLPAGDRTLPDGRLLRVAARDAPPAPSVIPQGTDVFARPIRIGARFINVESSFDRRPSVVNGTVRRELGRFVLPINVRIAGFSREEMIDKRTRVDRAVALAPLPAGVVAERPPLSEWTFSAAKLRLAALATFLPLLLFTAAAIALASIGAAAIALTPAAVALAFVAPALAMALARLDEMTLLAAGGALSCVTAFSATTLLRCGDNTGHTYRVLRDHFRPALGAALAAASLTGVAASARPAIGDAWRAPLIAALAILIVGIPAAMLLPAAIGVLLRSLRRRSGPAARARAHPAVWADENGLPELSVRNLTKVYANGVRALTRVTFELHPGVIGLLGPNGAGKTTLLRIVTGLLHPTRGGIAYRGFAVRDENIAEFRRVIGFLPQEFNAYPGLTAEQFLDFWALERGMDDARARRQQIEELLAAVGLEEHAGRRVRDFSGGMRQRIGIARALLGNPPLLVVDEPTTGLDIEARRRFRDLLTALARRRIVILSTHIASDIEAAAARVLLLARGTLRFDGTIEGLLSRARGRVFENVVSESDARDMVHRYRITTRVRLTTGVRVRGVLADDQPLPGTAVEPTLEEAYLSEISAGSPMRARSFSFLYGDPAIPSAGGIPRRLRGSE